MKLLYLGSLFFAAMGLPLAVEVPTSDGNAVRAFSSMADKFGIWATVATFLMIVIIVTAWYREQNMGKRIRELETALIEVVKQQKDVQNAVNLQTKVLEQVAKSADGQTKVLERIEIIFAQKTCPFNDKRA